MSCALARKALYTRAQLLFRDLAMARADGSLLSLLARLGRIDVLVIDDLGHGSDVRTRASRPLGDLRVSLPSALDDSKLRNCWSRASTNRSAIRHWLMASSTRSCPMHRDARWFNA